MCSCLAHPLAVGTLVKAKQIREQLLLLKVGPNLEFHVLNATKKIDLTSERRWPSSGLAERTQARLPIVKVAWPGGN